jgi:hypothetical protein
MRHKNRIIRYVVAVVLFACLMSAAPVGDSAAESWRTASGPAAVASQARVFRGWGFDTCHTPSTATMRAWLSSDYRAIGVYYAGRARGCRKQPNLTPDWVRSTTGMGWRIVPVYVGSQSPCVTNKKKRDYRMSADNAWDEGAAEARDAVSRADDLGFGPGSALYLDMETYRINSDSCTGPTLDFVRAWDREVSRQGYLPGFYSSADSGIAHMEDARRQGYGDLPVTIWYARWKVGPTLSDEPSLDSDAWQPHRRIHQYSGNVKEKHGGHQLTIDRNRLDAPVAVFESSHGDQSGADPSRGDPSHADPSHADPPHADLPGVNPWGVTSWGVGLWGSWGADQWGADPG